MAYFLNFYGTENTKTDKNVLGVYLNTQNEITVSIKEEDVEHLTYISFDKQTAIKLVKELKKQISLMEG